MYIGVVSKLTGVTPKGIRLYEKLRLIPIPNRRGKYRDYNNTDVELIKIIKQAQRLGFRLSEMKELFNEDISCEEFPWDKATILVHNKVQNIDDEIERLKNLRTELKEFITILKKRKCDY